MAYCRSCGDELSDDVRYCPECGIANESIDGQAIDKGKQNSGEGFHEDEPARSITVSKLIAYFFGAAGLLLGLFYTAEGNMGAGILLMIAGMIGLPSGRTQIESTLNVKLSKWVAAGLFLLFWITGAALL